MARICFHNRIATSTLTLPVSLVVGLVLWLVPFDMRVLAALPIAGVTAYMLMEMNNRNALIRVRSRMMSSLFWVGVPLVSMGARADGWSLLPMLLMSVSTYLLFASYDRREPVVDVFHCFVVLSMAVVLCPPLLVCVPAFLIYLIIYMRAWSARVCAASFLGLLLAGVCVAFYAVSSPAVFSAALPELRWPSAGDYSFNLAWLVTSALGLVGVWHYMGQSYDDKIQVRMMFYVIVCQWWIVQTLMLLVPSCVDSLLPVAWLFTAPMVAHQMSVSHSRWTSAWLIVVAAAVVVVLSV